MKKIFNSDKPIFNHENDKFNRYKFSKRIAETIVKRDNDEGLVIGLYGVWGEGKTSVLNILENELGDKDDVIVIKFNPWRFNSEDALILNFLKNLSNALDKELLNKTEKLGDFIKRYGSIGGIFNLDLSKIGESISDTELETLKNRVNEFLKESGKKIVVIIDDIDRLDKQELFSLFKLVKLTGDFTNTYYILSFDDEMVASAIGDRYANGDKKSGYNFLEKIIQVPLRIPKALPKALLDYTLELINGVLVETELELNDNESQNVGFFLSQYILPRISTPRLSVRFANSLSFLIPLVKGEVNHSDLILFEAIKIFYPDHYNFIKLHPEYFIESYDDMFSGGKDNNKVEEIKKHLDELNSTLSKVEIKCVSKLLTELFPRLNEALHNSYVHDAEKTWQKEKRIGSSKYFSRYFVYSVPTNELSDVFFDNFIKSIVNKELEECVSDIEDMLNNIDNLEFLNKLGFYEDSLEWSAKLKLIEIIVRIEDKFEDVKGVFMFGMNSPKSQAAITIYRFVKSHDNKTEQFDVARSLMVDSPFGFSMEILRWMKVGRTDEDKLFEIDKYEELNNSLLDRALEDCRKSDLNLFEKYDSYIFRLLDFWFSKDPNELDSYIKELLEKNPLFVKNIIYSLTSEIYTSSSSKPFKTDFKKESFDLISKFTNVENIVSIITSEYMDELKQDEVKFYDLEEGQNEINTLRQFLHWYDKSKV